MAKRVIDTNYLIDQFRLLAPYGGKLNDDARQCATELITRWGSDSIVSPVEIEFLAGITDPKEMDLAEAFLSQFRIIDDRKVIPQDWLESRRIARHVLMDSGRRDLGDCLIAAIADRLRFEVLSKDRGLRRQQGRTRQRRP